MFDESNKAPFLDLLIQPPHYRCGIQNSEERDDSSEITWNIFGANKVAIESNVDNGPPIASVAASK